MNWTDNIIFRALSRMCDLMLLNLLWIICSIPIITIGASTTALYTVMLKMVKNEEGYIARSYWQAFQDNFKKATILWGILLVLGVIIGLDIRFSTVMLEGTAGIVLQGVFYVFAIIWLCMVIYIFPLIARYENTVKNSAKNALILSIARLPYTLIMLVVTAGPVILTLLSVQSLLIGISLWIIIGIALVAWLNAHVLHKAFQIFHKDED